MAWFIVGSEKMRGCGRPEIESMIGTIRAPVKCQTKIFRLLAFACKCQRFGSRRNSAKPSRKREKRQTVSKDVTDCLSIQSLSEWNGKKTKNELWRITNFSPFDVGFSSKTSELPWFLRSEWESAIERWIASRRENDSIAINNFYLRHRRRFVRPTQHNPSDSASNDDAITRPWKENFISVLTGMLLIN